MLARLREGPKEGAKRFASFSPCFICPATVLCELIQRAARSDRAFICLPKSLNILNHALARIVYFLITPTRRLAETDRALIRFAGTLARSFCPRILPARGLSLEARTSRCERARCRFVKSDNRCGSALPGERTERGELSTKHPVRGSHHPARSRLDRARSWKGAALDSVLRRGGLRARSRESDWVSDASLSRMGDCGR
jgi:hypothetical protein